MEIVRFLTDIISHLNNLNVKLQEKQHTIFDLIITIRSFKKKIRNFQIWCLEQLFSFSKTFGAV